MYISSDWSGWCPIRFRRFELIRSAQTHKNRKIRLSTAQNGCSKKRTICDDYVRLCILENDSGPSPEPRAHSPRPQPIPRTTCFCFSTKKHHPLSSIPCDESALVKSNGYQPRCPRSRETRTPYGRLLRVAPCSITLHPAPVAWPRDQTCATGNLRSKRDAKPKK